MKKSDIIISVELDENHIPEQISWAAKDGGVDHQVTKAFLFSSWDDEAKEAMRIDLWTKKMTVDEMNMFFHQTLASLAVTYERATSEIEVAQRIREFAEDFAIASGIRD
ncbi:MAG: gliding motility protein GldC [Flavobacteriaceae bacterium]|nr:gliding motility protein GldC [Flavobacteriaceae bacterium]